VAGANPPKPSSSVTRAQAAMIIFAALPKR
jgi:hypothetical protein